jgi:intracellular multiplication protein IcmP
LVDISNTRDAFSGLSGRCFYHNHNSELGGVVLSDDKPNTHDNAIGWGILLFVLFLIFILFWYFQGDNIKDAARWVRVAEMWLVTWFTTDDYLISWHGKEIPFVSVYEAANLTTKDELSSDAMSLISTAAMYPYRYIFTVILTLLGFWALLAGPKTQFRTTLGLDNLIKRQARIFPAISPFVTFNPSNQPPRPPGAPVPAELPSFSEALSPEEWVAYFEVPVPDGKVDADAAARAFAKQLGAPWRGPVHMKPYRQVLLAAFCLKSLRKRAEADDMLGRLAKCWSFEGGLKLDPVLLRDARRILNNRDMSGKILSKCNQHAYENTALLRALATAREEGGVMAPAQFVWMRGYDRTLWYPLNNLGRQAYHMEALGAMCHYKAEKGAQRPIPRPKMEDAVKAISDHMMSSNARPIPQLDYSKSKKRGIKKLKSGS